MCTYLIDGVSRKNKGGRGQPSDIYYSVENALTTTYMFSVSGNENFTFYFGVKFYAADPCKLVEEITR